MNHQPLTRYREASFRELVTISIPMMLSLLSGNVMFFADRLMLAKYSIGAMNAAATTGMTVLVMEFGAVGIASIAEVFVGQKNGAELFDEVGRPVWQMLWFSFATTLIFLPVALFAGPYLLPSYHYADHALPYFQWLLYFSAFSPCQAALAAFFIGLGKTRLVTYAMLFGNVLNVGLNLILIPKFGTKGAAIGTSVALVIQVVILFVFFLSKQNRLKYGTTRYAFHLQEFLKCLKVGIPNSIGHIVEVGAWTIILRLMLFVHEDYVTIFAFGQGLYSLVGFTMEGVQKSVTAICANFIGAEKWELIHANWKSAVKFLCVMSLFVGVLLVIFPNFLINAFVPEAVHLHPVMRIVCMSVFAYFILDGLAWISAGVLMAAGDTLFIMFANGILVWVFAILPVYLCVVRGGAAPQHCWTLVNIYACINACIFYIRYRRGNWKKRALVT